MASSQASSTRRSRNLDVNDFACNISVSPIPKRKN